TISKRDWSSDVCSSDLNASDNCHHLLTSSSREQWNPPPNVPVSPSPQIPTTTTITTSLVRIPSTSKPHALRMIPDSNRYSKASRSEERREGDERKAEWI